MARTTFGADFLKAIDAHIAARHKRITCSALAGIFWETFEALKQETGTSAGFSGLSEYLLFKFIYHALGGTFEKATRECTTQGLLRFCHTSDGALSLCRGLHFSVPHSVTPDVVVSLNSKVVAAYEVKVYPTTGLPGLKTEIGKLAALRRSASAAPNMRAMMVFFNAAKYHPGAADMLRREVRVRPWLHVVWLREDSRLAVNALAKSMLWPSILDRAFKGEL